MSSTALAEIQLQQPGDKPHLFQKGHPRCGGRQKGSRNRFGVVTFQRSQMIYDLLGDPDIPAGVPLLKAASLMERQPR
jgi:hypothetical protein